MKQIAITFLLFFGLTAVSQAQLTIEEQVADTACACMSKLDTVQIKSNSNVIKMQCLREAIEKNQEAIMNNYATEQRSEEDQAKIGLRGSMLIKVQNVLIEKCGIYALFEQRMQMQRQSGRGQKNAK